MSQKLTFIHDCPSCPEMTEAFPKQTSSKSSRNLARKCTPASTTSQVVKNDFYDTTLMGSVGAQDQELSRGQIQTGAMDTVGPGRGARHMWL